MTDKQQPEALRLALDLEALDLDGSAAAVRRMHAELETIRAALAAGQAPAQAVVPDGVMLPAVAAHEIHEMLQEVAALLDSMPESISEQLQVRHFFRDELEGGMLLMKDALTAPAQPAARRWNPMEGGNPETALQMAAVIAHRDAQQGGAYAALPDEYETPRAAIDAARAAQEGKA